MYAAGMTIKPENYVVFKEAFEKQVQDTITDNLRVQEIEIDAEINFTDITKLIRILNSLSLLGH
jgi:single-stranded-DNA-specific exonuclease